MFGIFTHNTELPFLSLKQLLFFLLLIFLNVSLSATTSFLLKFLRGPEKGCAPSLAEAFFSCASHELASLTEHGTLHILILSVLKLILHDIHPPRAKSADET